MTDPTTQSAMPGQDSAPSEPVSFADKLRRWFLRASIAGMVLSLGVHIVLFIIAALVVTAVGGGDGQSARPAIEFAVMSQSQLDSFQSEELSVDEPNSQELLEQSLADAPDSLLDITLTEMIQPEGRLDADIASGGGDLSSAHNPNSSGAGIGAASFFGIEARGNRFAYIVDVSGSMDRGGRIDAMRAELSESISAMPDHVSFFVVLYADTAYPLGDRRKWTDANRVGKRWARTAITKLAPLGATKPMPAFEMVYDIRPRPDAIYFMTDGEFDEGIAEIIIRRNKDRPIPVHCITFMTRSAETVMKRIASSTGGTYTHISRSTP
ncbi:MAG: hypothetical protein COB69_01830 [Phycisphaera sp.]|nr:MAG: hypothetical protein COB69_01830 [Phycisphaera sp.]